MNCSARRCVRLSKTLFTFGLKYKKFIKYQDNESFSIKTFLKSFVLGEDEQKCIQYEHALIYGNKPSPLHVSV
jgi:hypothetical protein